MFKLNSFRLYFLALIIFTGCAYFNTMFNALKLYDQGTLRKSELKTNQITPEIRKSYYSAIDKCWSLINLYGDSSEYADDALLLIGKSYIQVEEYTKAERFLTQFTQKYRNSDLIGEARLWLARALLEEKKEDQARAMIDELLLEDTDTDIKASAFFTSGKLYYNHSEYNDAIAAFEKCLELSDNDELSGETEFILGNIYFDQENYVSAVDHYNSVREYETPVHLEYEAMFRKVVAQSELEKYDLAQKTLLSMLRESRFKNNYSEIEAKIGEIYELQNKTDQAADQYLYVMEKYPRSFGSAQSAFNLGHIVEDFYADPDSALTLFKRVRKENSRSDFVEEADRQAGILAEYLKLNANLTKSRHDLEMAIQARDSLRADSIALADSLLNSAVVAATIDSADTSATDSVQVVKNDAVKAAKPPKRAGPSIKTIKETIQKNYFALAEFFLLTLQKPDSAELKYSEFISQFDDSVRTPRAYHALNYLYAFILKDSVKADSIESIILEKYPESKYADYILRARGQEVNKEVVVVDTLKEQYHQAENALQRDDFESAITQFSKIATIDSGGTWGEKSRFAIAWIYENKLKDVEKAVAAYTAFADEYPRSKASVLAKNKIKEPAPEVEPAPVDSTAVSDSTVVKSKQAPAEIKPSQDTKPAVRKHIPRRSRRKRNN